MGLRFVSLLLKHLQQCYLWALCALLVSRPAVGGDRVALYDSLLLAVADQGLSDASCLFTLAQRH